MTASPRGWEDLARFLEIYEKLGKTVDRDVVYQYIEHPRIAKDFANYLELYRKYRSDYQIEKILGEALNEELIRRVSAAAFDEKLSVISLILAHLNGRFREIYDKEQYLERLFGERKKLDRMMAEDGRAEERGRQNAANALGTLAASLEREISGKRKAGLPGREEDIGRRLQSLQTSAERT